jgi:aspartate racemase
MGPEATVLLMQKVIAAVAAQDDADHVPLIVDQNSQVPSRIRHLIEGTGDDPGPVLREMARRLEAAGAEALAMACNTAHYYSDAIRGAVRIQFIDVVELSATRAAALAGHGGRVGILASPAVSRVALFDAALAARGLTALYPEDESTLLTAIRRIKAEGPGATPREALAAAATELAARGADVQMIACTEFSLATSSVTVGAPIFDTVDLLAEAIVAFATDAPPGRSGLTQPLTRPTGP